MPASDPRSLPDQRATEQIAFVVVRLGKRDHLDAGTALLDVQEAIDAVPGCTTESFGAFPESERKDIMAYVQAARAAADEERPNV